MESAGSAVVDFGRFCTAFLVVMGVGKRSRGFLLLRGRCEERWVWRYAAEGCEVVTGARG